MSSKITCLVTLHGIGFEQPPKPGVPNSGYADPLHQHLKKCLGTLLSDDPNRTEGRMYPGDLFHWGHEIHSLYRFESWYNFKDRCDPVADPLNPPKSWEIGDKIGPSDETLFECIDLGDIEPFWIKINDIPVDNVKNSHGGGLQAHNYWDNEQDFVKQVAQLLSTIAEVPLIRAA